MCDIEADSDDDSDTPDHAPPNDPAAMNPKTAYIQNAGRLLACVMCALIVLWVAFFVIGCILVHSANVPAVHAACGGFWEFMVVALVSPALIPIGYAILGLGAFAWQDYYAIATVVLAIAALYMTSVAANSSQCQDAIRDTTPPEPWLIFFGWIKGVAYLAAAVSAVFSRYITKRQC